MTAKSATATTATTSTYSSIRLAPESPSSTPVLGTYLTDFVLMNWTTAKTTATTSPSRMTVATVKCDVGATSELNLSELVNVDAASNTS
jgi:hypothetical protein